MPQYALHRGPIYALSLIHIWVVPWKGLIALIEPHYPKGEGGRPAYPLMAMLRVHLLQNWFGYSDPAMEEALYETTILRQFAGLNLERIPDETTLRCQLVEIGRGSHAADCARAGDQRR